MVDEIEAKMILIQKRQDDLDNTLAGIDERLKGIEVNKDEFYELKRTNATLHKEIEDLRNDIETQYQTSNMIQKEAFDKMNQVYGVVLGFKNQDRTAQREWIVALIGALGGGVTVTLIFQWLTSL